MTNKTMTNNLKKSGIKSFCAIMVAASMMSIAMPVFAESNENLDECYAVETQVQDELMPLSEAASIEEAASVEETASVEEAATVEEVAAEEAASIEETASVEEVAAEEAVPVEEVAAEEAVPVEEVAVEEAASVQEEAPTEKEETAEEAADCTVNKEDSEPGAVSQATTETQDTASKFKPMLDENRAAWIYREMNEGWGEPEEVIPVEPVGIVEPEVFESGRMYRERRRQATEEEIWKGEYDKVLSYRTRVDQYDIEPGKYYHLVIDKPSGNVDFMPLMRLNRRDTDMIFVKVLDVYEDPKWYGSERTVEYMDVATGEINKVQPNANWFRKGTCNDFYEVYSIERVIERIRVL